MKRITTLIVALLIAFSLQAQQNILKNKKYDLATAGSGISVNLLSDAQMIFVSGTKTLSAPYAVGVTGTPVDGKTILMFWDGTSLTPSTNTVTVFGVSLTAKQATSKLIVLAVYKTNAWEVRITNDAKTTAWIGKDDFGTGSYDDTTVTVGGSGIKVKDGGITNAKVNSSAAIAVTKLALTHAIDSGMISLTAKIPFKKMLPLTAGYVPYTDANGFLTASATTSAQLGYLVGVTSAIQTQINTKTTSGSIVNADVNASAAIAYSKLNLGTSIVNADIAVACSLAWAKMYPLTASRIPYINSSGVIAASSVTDTELGYISGLTSNAQSQITAARSSRTYTRTSATTIALSGSATDSYLITNTTGRITVTLPAATDFSANHIIEFTRLSNGSTDSIFIVAPGGTDLVGVTGANVSSYILPGNVAGGAGVGLITDGTSSWRYIRRG